MPWHLPASIDFKRSPADPIWERHLYVESNGQFRAELGPWEADVLREELAKPEVVGWLRNLKTTELAKTGDSRKYQTIGECTLVCHSEKAAAKVKKVSPS